MKTTKITFFDSDIVGNHWKRVFIDDDGIEQRVEFYVGEEQVGFIGRLDIGEDKL